MHPFLLRKKIGFFLNNLFKFFSCIYILHTYLYIYYLHFNSNGRKVSLGVPTYIHFTRDYIIETIYFDFEMHSGNIERTYVL